MPNYNLVVTAQYRPYTFDEMAKPLLMYKTELDKQTEAAAALSDEAAKRLSFLDPNVDSEQYMQYKAATDEIYSLADDLATNGLNPNSLARATKARRTLQSLITPLDYAIQNREKEKEIFMEMKLKHPEILISRDPYATPISAYYPNANTPEFKTININDIYTLASGRSKAFASQFSDVDIKRLDDMFFKYIKEVGLKGSPEEIMKSKEYPEFEAMRQEIENSIDFRGFSEDQEKLIKAKILQGIKDGILGSYNVSTDVKNDPTAATRMKLGIAQAVKAQKDAEKAAKNGENTLLGAFKAKESTIRLKHYPTSDNVRNAAKHAEELIAIPDTRDLSEFEQGVRDKLYDWSTADPDEGFQLPIIGNPTLGAKPIVEKSMGKYYKAFEPIPERIETGRDKDGNYTETTKGVADYKLNLDNLPEKMQKDFIDTFGALGIKVKNGMYRSDLEKALKEATKTQSYAIDDKGNITPTEINKNLNFGEAQMIQLNIHPSEAKSALSNYILELIDGDEFYAGTVKEIKGAKSVNGRYVGSLDFKNNKVSAKKFKEALKDADGVKMYAYSDDENSGVVVNIGDGKEYFIDTVGSQSMNSFTNTLRSADLKRVAQNADAGFSFNGTYIPYTSLLESPHVKPIINKIDYDEKYINFLNGAGGALFTEEEKKKKLKELRDEIAELRNRYIYPNNPQFGKINDIIQAMESAVSYAKFGDDLSVAFSNANSSGYKGTAFKQDASISQFIKYTGDPFIDAFLSDSTDEESTDE